MRKLPNVHRHASSLCYTSIPSEDINTIPFLSLRPLAATDDGGAIFVLS
jgi:hypothetical protein